MSLACLNETVVINLIDMKNALLKLHSRNLNLTGFFGVLILHRASLIAQLVKNLPAMQETQVRSLGRKVSPPGEGSDNLLQYSCLENPMDRGLGGLQSMESQRVRHNCVCYLTQAQNNVCLNTLAKNKPYLLNSLTLVISS